MVEQPMSPRPGPVTGREELRRHFAAAAAGPLELSPRTIAVHETSDPEVIIAEYEYEVHNTETGGRTTVANIQVLRVRDGLIVASRDYHDHLRLAATAGRAGELAAALDGAGRGR
jgi:ketosteroid isomerase-like protein